MDIEYIKEKTLSIILDLLPSVRTSDILEGCDIFDLGLDSINAMTLVFELQDVFDVKFEASDINVENFRTIADISEMIQSKKEQIT